MEKLTVNFSKLKRYIDQQGGYDLEQDSNKITLSFVPAFPEALEKSWDDKPAPRVIMHGKISGSSVLFDSVQIEEDGILRPKDLEVAELTYRSWLQFIEDNY
ncbi:MAG: hypothetical protein ACYCQJ_05980 [Nitrososphaerales archaeon]